MAEELIDFTDLLDDVGQQVDSLALLSQLADEHADLRIKLAEAQERANKLANEVKDLEERRIPDIMRELKLTSFTTQDGFTITLKEDVFASISEARAEQAHAWLDANGHGGLVKRNVIVAFGRDDESWCNRFLGNLKRYKRALDVKVTRKVEPSTLKKFAREQLAVIEAAEAEGAQLPDFPRELFGVFVKKVAKIKPPKEK